MISKITFEYFSEIVKNENRFKTIKVQIKHVKISSKNTALKNLLNKILIEKSLLKILENFKNILKSFKVQLFLLSFYHFRHNRRTQSLNEYHQYQLY